MMNVSRILLRPGMVGCVVRPLLTPFVNWMGDACHERVLSAASLALQILVRAWICIGVYWGALSGFTFCSSVLTKGLILGVFNAIVGKLSSPNELLEITTSIDWKTELILHDPIVASVSFITAFAVSFFGSNVIAAYGMFHLAYATAQSIFVDVGTRNFEGYRIVRERYMPLWDRIPLVLKIVPMFTLRVA